MERAPAVGKLDSRQVIFCARGSAGHDADDMPHIHANRRRHTVQRHRHMSTNSLGYRVAGAWRTVTQPTLQPVDQYNICRFLHKQ